MRGARHSRPGQPADWGWPADSGLPDPIPRDTASRVKRSSENTVLTLASVEEFGTLHKAIHWHPARPEMHAIIPKSPNPNRGCQRRYFAPGDIIFRFIDSDIRFIFRAAARNSLNFSISCSLR